MTELNLDSKWYCYCILGKVNSKSESLHYLNNWLKLYKLIDDFLQDCPVKSLLSEQRKDIILKIDKDGIPRTIAKKLSTGGTLQWNEKNNKKICNLYLQQQLEEIIDVEKNGKDYYEWLIEQYPNRNSSVSFERNHVKGYLIENINVKKARNEYPDFLFQLSPTFNPNKSSKVNFEIHCYVSERYSLKKGINVVDEFILKIGKIAKAIKIGRAKTLYQKRYVDKYGTNRIRGYVGDNFADRETMNFSKIGIENWETIFD